MAILTLGQSGSMSSMFIWILILIVLVVVGGGVIIHIRRRMLLNDDSVSVGSSGLLDHIHELHRAGEIDDDEYGRARNAILRTVQDDIDARKAVDAGPDTSILNDLDIDL